MTIPDFQTAMFPLLKLTGNRQEWALRDLADNIAEVFSLSDEERNQLLPSGRQTTILNRVGWAATHLRKAGLIESTRRGYNRITDLGVEVLSQPIDKIDLVFLDQFPGHKEFRTANRNSNGKPAILESAKERTPEETIEDAFQSVQEGIVTDLLERIMSCSPGFFERLVIDLLVRMGYGGTRKDAGHAVGKSGDGGIDGIINEDRLGLDVIYIQAKRWEGVVGRPEIQKFAGALQGQRARKGIFITTSAFTKEAKDYVSYIDSKIVLVDGQTLAELMINYNVGVNTHTTYELKRIDQDYFSEE